MSGTTMLNVRIDKDLKAQGQQVLNREGISTTEVIRRMYTYLSTHQQLPPCLKESEENDTFLQRRILLRQIACCAPVEMGGSPAPSVESIDIHNAARLRAVEKYERINREYREAARS